MSSTHLHHGWAREEEKRRGWEGESFRSDGEEMEWLGMKMEAVGKRGGGGGGGGLNRGLRKVKGRTHLISINGWLVVRA